MLDRVDLSSYSDDIPTTPIDVDKLLIKDDDIAQLNSDAIVLMSRYLWCLHVTNIFNLTFIFRILVQHMDKFSSEAESVSTHIPSKYSKAMSCKSKVVCFLLLVL